MPLGISASPALSGEETAAFERRLMANVAAPMGLGLSGGGDSLALLHIAKGWADAHGRRLVAFTVDHGLNADSARWTAFAGEAARAAGVEWRALAWIGPKPTAGLPAAARAARHRLLADAAREIGAAVILLGHTADDVAEAELMRERDAPALGRLREWAPSPAWPQGRGVFLLRPLLTVRREALRGFLRARGLTWIEDPANEDPRFARARARRLLNPTPAAGEGDGGGGATPPLAVASEGPATLGRGDGRFAVTSDGRVIARRNGLTSRFVSAALLCAGGGDVPPRGERLARLMDRLAEKAGFSASLAGARVTAEGDEVQFGREAGERSRGGLGPVELRPGGVAIWDGRFEVAASEPGWRVEALAGRVGALSRAERLWLKTLPPAARSALPVLAAERGVALPQPFGSGPAIATSLVEARLCAACGLLDSEQSLFS